MTSVDVSNLSSRFCRGLVRRLLKQFGYSIPHTHVRRTVTVLANAERVTLPIISMVITFVSC